MKPAFCLKHKNSQIFGLIHEEKQTYFICDECLVQLQIQKQETIIRQLIDIDKALEEPAYLINQLRQIANKLDFLETLNSNIDKITENFKQKTNQLILLIQEMQKEYDDYYKKIQVTISQMIKELAEINECQTFCKLIDSLQINYENNQIINEIEDKLHKLFPKTNDQSFKVFQNIFQYYDKATNELQQNWMLTGKIPKINAEVEKLQKDLVQTVYNFLSTGFTTPSSICSSTFQYLISEKFPSSNIDLIYKGSRNGLSHSQFWYYVQGKSNLLMIFRSSSGRVFGGYTPCMWNQSANNYVTDTSQSSFIFSDTYKEIYPLKQNETRAIYCHPSYVAYFGTDLNISNDFRSGSSYLGQFYKSEKYDGSSTSNYLFGQSSPYITECEVYQITKKES